jgi:aminotransferase
VARIANRMKSIPFSGIRRVFEEVSRREELGEKIIHLEIGRPDFDTPRHIKEAAKRALDEGKVHYSSNYGIPELREAVTRKLKEDNGLSYDPNSEIIVTVGANEAVLAATMGLLNPGDEVLIPDPCRLHYFHCAQMAGAIPNLRIAMERMKGALTRR